MLNTIMLSVIMLSFIMLGVIMLSAIMLSVLILSVIMLGVIMGEVGKRRRTCFRRTYCRLSQTSHSSANDANVACRLRRNLMTFSLINVTYIAFL